MKSFRFLIILIALSLLTGCGMTGSVYSNYRALEDLRLIQTLGYDADGTGVTLSASSGKPLEDGAPILLRRGGPSILEAMDSLQDYATQGQLFFSHANYVVVGREAAERGIGGLLDFAERDLRMRLDTELFLLREGAAADLIMGPGDDSYDVTEVLASVKQDVDLRGISHVANFRETAVSLSEYGAALVCLLRTVTTEGSIKLESDGLSAVPDGYGILKDGVLVGAVDGERAEAVSLLLGYPGTVSRTFPDGAGGTVTLRFDGTGGGFKPSWNGDGSPGPVEVRLSVRAVVAETDSVRGRILSDEDCLKRLEEQLRQSLEENLRAVLAQSQTLDADFLALGRALRLSGGERFYALPSGWLPGLEFRVTTDAVIDRSYDLNDPLRMDGGRTG